MIDESMARVSLQLAYSAIAVYTAAFVGYAAAAASTIGARDEARSRPEPALVGTGAGADVPPPADSPEPGAMFPGRKAAGIATALTLLAFVLQLGSVITRTISVHRVPWGNMHEFTLTTSTVVAGAFLIVALRDRTKQLLGVFVVPVVLLALGLSVTVLYADAAELVPALKSGLARRARHGRDDRDRGVRAGGFAVGAVLGERPF